MFASKFQLTTNFFRVISNRTLFVLVIITNICVESYKEYTKHILSKIFVLVDRQCKIPDPIELLLCLLSFGSHYTLGFIIFFSRQSLHCRYIYFCRVATKSDMRINSRYFSLFNFDTKIIYMTENVDCHQIFKGNMCTGTYPFTRILMSLRIKFLLGPSTRDFHLQC